MRIPILVGVSLLVSLVVALVFVISPEIQPEQAPEATTHLRTFGEPVRPRRSSVIATLVDEMSEPAAAPAPAPHPGAAAKHRDDLNDLY
jgi:hypothetical protein